MTINRIYPVKNKLKPIVCIYTSIDFNTHNKRILYDHVKYIYQRSGREYNTNMRVLQIPRSAHDKGDILHLHISISIQNNQLQWRHKNMNNISTNSIWSKCLFFIKVCQMFFVFFLYMNFINASRVRLLMVTAPTRI